MFFAISKTEQATHPADGLQNPQNPSNPMVLAVYRTLMRTAVCSVYSKKAFGEFWDGTDRKTIPKGRWTPEMKAFAKQKVAGAPRPPFIFKLTVAGWIFVLLVVAFFGFMAYNGMKPPKPKSAETVAMEKKPAAGDIYFGHFETYKQKGNPLGAKTGHGWFRIDKVTGEDFYIAKSKEMSKTHQPKEQLNSTDFEAESLPLKLSEQTGYNIRFKSADGLTEVYITDKK